MGPLRDVHVLLVRGLPGIIDSAAAVCWNRNRKAGRARTRSLPRGPVPPRMNPLGLLGLFCGWAEAALSVMDSLRRVDHLGDLMGDKHGHSEREDK